MSSHEAGEPLPRVPAGGARVLLVVGSSRSGRTGSQVGRWSADRLQQRLGYRVPTVYTSDLPLAGSPDADAVSEDPTPSALLAWATSTVIVTPEYNRSFPASLKAYIDHHRWEWVAMPVGFISYGGMSRGLRAVEQLRSVLTELHAVGVRDGVAFGSSGTSEESALTVAPALRAFDRMMDHLLWWDEAVSRASARRAHPSLAELQALSG